MNKKELQPKPPNETNARNVRTDRHFPQTQITRDNQSYTSTSDNLSRVVFQYVINRGKLSPQKRPCRAIRFKNSKQGREKRSRTRADRSRDTLRIARSPALEGRKREVVAPSGPQSLLSRRKPSSSASAPNPSPPPRAAVRSHSASPDLLPFWQQTWFLVLLLLMGLSFFALSLFLFLGLDLDGGSPTIVESAANGEGVEITYGSVVKLMHERTKFRLHSHDVPYGSGSGQQSVTGFPNVDDANSYWIVRPQPDSSEKQGDVIKSSSIIRFQHMRTRKWLHSHLHASPISGNLEVSCYGGDGVSDTGDYWRLEIEGSGKTWKQDQRVRLQHIDTGGYLHSHDKKYSRIAGGQQEVCGVREKRADNIWLATEGVYLPVNESK